MAAENPCSANILGACSNITIRDVIGMTSPEKWTITFAPAAYTGKRAAPGRQLQVLFQPAGRVLPLLK